MADTIHFSVLMRRALCGSVALHYTAKPSEVTCERCKQFVAKASATEVDLWALEAAQDLKTLKEKSALNAPHVTALFAFSLERRANVVKRAQESVEYALTELESMKKHALDFDTEVAMAMDGM